jgi:hypothetical protein
MARSSSPDEHESRLPTASLHSHSVATACEPRALSWKRVCKGLVVGLSVCWLVLFYITGAAMDPWHTSVQRKAINTVITIVAVPPILLLLRGRCRYVPAALFLLVVVWTLWNYWIHVERMTGE